MSDARACLETGCPGHYLDGYCDWCGSPEPAAATAPAPTATADVGAGSSTGAAQEDISALQSHRAVATPRPGGAPTRATAIGSARATGVRRQVRESRWLRRSSLGAGLTQVPPAPRIDPRAAVMSDPRVPEDKRNCPSCGAPVGRSHDESPGREQGYCPKCRNPFSFTPKLSAGDLVAGQYEVVGCLAHGGLGWIYLARDRNVSNRWVVLKGLLNAGDADAVAAAVAEQQFLAQVEHPLIVEVYNVVTHEGAAYTVMEYVGGVSLKQILKDRLAAKGSYDPLPIEHALAYIIEILPAFSYLHDHGLLYCDFKPDNLIQEGDGVKLIDLGGVRRIDDLDSPIYGTIGYQAPEVAEQGPSIPGDIYTIGRTLVVLTTEFRGYQSRYVDSLPPISETPAFRENDAFYRLVAKACAPDPADRFATIEELRGQAMGVLRQAVADRRGSGAATQTAASYHFDVPIVAGETFDWWELPAMKPDESDSMNTWLRSLQEQDPQARLTALRNAPEITPEVVLEMGRTALRAGRPELVAQSSDALLSHDPWDWRAVWLLGIDALARGDTATATDSFAAVYHQVPGELAPRLGLALSAETAGQNELAEISYLTCLRTDAGYVVASAFGLARVRAARGDHRGALNAIELVPPTSGAYPRARWLRADLMTRLDGGLPTLVESLRSISTLVLEPRARATFTVHVLERALSEVLRKGPATGVKLEGVPADEPHLRQALERAYRTLADLTTDSAERHDLVDKANAIRPWSFT
ncbi:serine/threonine-protein kinase [Gephyromycinifex aptenodytis]|uniref:serine/threonine-protein kinase n=1 Tax=Gephyromycinifex aptenodytis TaxID=2716227 RepID=UPI001447A986|nr:serine/threonine-protein kinase [Gephyromycinifex aptenodytis]